MNGNDDAHKWFENHSNYVRESDMPEYAWECFKEAAIDYEPFHDEDGERLPEYEDDKLDESKEWTEYCNDFCSALEGIQEECRVWDACGRDPYAYYGVSRSDFA
tara:strand:- start:2729 stop:3040 length:312 start_codon:yes stop_codon:yes gene_type:complete